MSMPSETFEAPGEEPIRIRAAAPADREALANFYSALSARSRYFRFFSSQAGLPRRFLERESIEMRGI